MSVLVVRGFFLFLSLVLGSVTIESAFGGGGKRATSEIADALRAALETPPTDRPLNLMTARFVPFYQQRKFEPIWFDDGEISEKAFQVLQWIGKASEHGLQPEWYGAGYLQDQLPKFRKNRVKSNEAARAAVLELKISEAYVSLSEDMQWGRVDARDLKRLAASDPGNQNASAALKVAVDSGVEARFRAAVRTEPPYRALQKKLEELRQLQKTGGWPHIPAGSVLKKGDKGKRVRLLRRRLLGAAASSGKKAKYDSSLVLAVRGFQRIHGLRENGVVDGATLELLNLSLPETIRKVQINLERLRWVPREPPRTHVLVDLAAFTLTLQENGAQTLKMKVIVGDHGWKTPIFAGQISYLVVNPTWTVPTSIAEQMLPKIIDNAEYLTEQNIKVLPLDGKGKEIDAKTIDWKSLMGKKFPYRLVQNSGPTNPMGRVKFMFPNEFEVYLHDTPSNELFNRPVRTFSHGCVRLERPLDLAEHLLLLNREPKSREDLEDLIATGKETNIPLSEPVAVFLLYRTAWASPDGEIQFRRDVYGTDDQVWKAMAGT